MGRPRRWLPFAAALAIAAAAGGAWVGYWWLAGERMRTATLATIEHARARGYRVDYAAIGRAGFPARARIVLAEPRVSAPDAAPAAGPAWRWAGAQVAVEVALLSPSAPAITTAGRQAITLRDAGRERTYAGHVAALRYAYAQGGWLPAGRLTVRDLALRAEADGDALAVDALEATGSGDPEAGLDAGGVSYRLRLDATGITPPAALGLPVAPRIDHAAIELHLKGTLAPQPWPDALGAWRDAGGIVELPAVVIRYGPLAAQGSGTLALDRAHQPIGAMRLDVRGLPAALAALSARGLIEPRLAGALAGVLGASAADGGGGTDATVAIPITLQDRVLAVGPLPIARLPALVWAGTRP